MRTFSDNPKTFTFHYTFKDFETAQVGAHALMGYMVGAYHQPVIDVSYRNDDQGGTANQLCVKYAEDRKLNKVFKKICDAFKDYNNQPEDMTDEDIDEILQENELLKELAEANLNDTKEIEHQYKLERMEQLKQSETFDSLLDKVVAYELELLDYAERLSSDDPTPLTNVTACSTLELLGDDAIDTLKRVDTDQEYKGLWN